MEYHMQYSPTEDIKNEKEAFVEKPIKRKIIKKSKILLLILSVSVFSIFSLILIYYSKIGNKNVLKETYNENLNDDFIINTLLKSKHGRKFIASKLEELISNYGDNNKNSNDMKNKENEERGTNKSVVTYEEKEKKLRTVKKEFENLNNVQFLMNNLEAVNSFYTFLKTYEKKYKTSSEMQERFSIFMQNYKKIEEHNKKDSLYKKSINKFADLPHEEFKKIYLNLKKSDSIDKLKSTITFDNYYDIIPMYKTGEFDKVHHDWREHSGLTPVRDQNTCGSCWAFSSLGAVESQYLIRKKEELHLSEQQIVDCVTRDMGCNGGYIMDAFIYMLESEGLCSYKDYPYDALQHPMCLYNQCKNKYKIVKSIVPIPPDKTKEAIAFIGPVAITYSAAEDFEFYGSGIYDGECARGINHAMLIVGYGVEEVFNKRTNKNEKVHYYILKNSWGVKWGENGFARIITNEDGSYKKCQLADEAYIALVE